MSFPEILLIAIGLGVGLAILAFWLWMLFDCLTKEPKEGNDRLVWLLVIVFVKLFGAVFYYFLRYRKRGSLEPAASGGS